MEIHPASEQEESDKALEPEKSLKGVVGLAVTHTLTHIAKGNA
jgi:hypothetical protein